MNEAAESVHTASVTYAVRDSVFDGRDIHAGDIMGLVDNELHDLGHDVRDVAEHLIVEMVTEDESLITVYYGEDVSEADAQVLTDELAQMVRRLRRRNAAGRTAALTTIWYLWSEHAADRSQGHRKNQTGSLTRKAGICSLRDLLYTFPVRYRDLSSPTTVRQAQPGESVCLLLSRLGEAKLSRHGKLSRVTCTFADETGQISACWFNQPWMREHLNAGTRFMLYGRMEACGAGKRMTNPSLEKELGAAPVYRARYRGVPQRLHQAAVRQALEAAEQACPETLPERLLAALWPVALRPRPARRS